MKPDNINPSHYQFKNGLQAIDIIESVLGRLNSKITPHEAFLLGNALKYLLRVGVKNEDKLIEDLKKAEWYIGKFIKDRKVSNMTP